MTTLFIILFALLVYLSLYLAYKAGKKAEYFSLQRKAQKALDLTFTGVKTKEDMDKALDKAGYRDWETDRKSTRLNSSHITRTRMPSSA